MDFKKIIVDGIAYGDKYIPSIVINEKNVDFKDPTFIDNTSNPKIQFALKALALCHNIIVDKTQTRMEYNASSPDELALVNFSRNLGFVYEGIDIDDHITL